MGLTSVLAKREGASRPARDVQESSGPKDIEKPRSTHDQKVALNPKPETLDSNPKP